MKLSISTKYCCTCSKQYYISLLIPSMPCAISNKFWFRFGLLLNISGEEVFVIAHWCTGFCFSSFEILRNFIFTCIGNTSVFMVVAVLGWTGAIATFLCRCLLFGLFLLVSVLCIWDITPLRCSFVGKNGAVPPNVSARSITKYKALHMLQGNICLLYYFLTVYQILKSITLQPPALLRCMCGLIRFWNFLWRVCFVFLPSPLRILIFFLTISARKDNYGT